MEMSRERDEPMSEAQLEVAWMVVLLGGALVLMGGVALNVLIDHLAVSFALAGVQVGLLAAVIGVLLEDFVVGTVVALVPGAVVVGIWWRRFLD